MITVYYNGKPYQYADSTKYLELARTLQPQFEHDIVLASVNGKLQELWKYIKDGASVSFLTTQSQAGIMAYRRSVVLLLLKALKDTISKERLGSNQVKVEFSLSKGLFCHFDKGLVLDEEELKQVQTSMEILREANYPIEKYSISTEAAIEQFGKAKMTDKERLFRFRRASKVNIYSLDGLEDYYYGYMVPSTGYLKYFKLYSYEDGFVLQMPVREAPEVIPEFEPQHKLFKVMRETGKWGEELGVATVGELNELITGKTNKKSSCRDITDLISYSDQPLTAEDTEFEIRFEHVKYQDKDGVAGVDYTAPSAEVELTIAGAEQLTGDVNGDSFVNEDDAKRVVQIANGEIEASEEQLKAADVDGDGEVDAMDAELIYGYCKGRLKEFPADTSDGKAN